jgi:hypothetical protein
VDLGKDHPTVQALAVSVRLLKIAFRTKHETPSAPNPAKSEPNKKKQKSILMHSQKVRKSLYSSFRRTPESSLLNNLQTLGPGFCRDDDFLQIHQFYTYKTALFPFSFSFHKHPPIVPGSKTSYRPGQKKDEQQQVTFVGVDERFNGMTAMFAGDLDNGFVNAGPFPCAKSDRGIKEAKECSRQNQKLSHAGISFAFITRILTSRSGLFL